MCPNSFLLFMKKLGSWKGVVGTQHGDEAKGKIVDVLADEADEVVRYNGANNAGHKIYNTDGSRSVVLSQAPSGVLKGKRGFIAANSLFSPSAYFEELERIKKFGVDNAIHLTRIATQASLIQPHQRLRDVALAKEAIGTTGRGIGPGYGDRAMRTHGERQLDLRMGVLLEDTQKAMRIMQNNYDAEVALLERDPECDQKRLKAAIAKLNIKDLMAQEFDAINTLVGLELIEKDPAYIVRRLQQGMNILAEGAQSLYLANLGTTPYITSSDPSVGGAISCGMPWQYLKELIFVAKSIPTRVGKGPFITEYGGSAQEAYCMEDEGDKHNRAYEQAAYGHRLDACLRSNNPLEFAGAVRSQTDEYGGVSGRPRRLGEFDAYMIRTAIEMYGATGLHLSKVDCLQLLKHRESIRIGVGYAQSGKNIDYVPTNEADARRTEAVYREYGTFDADISNAKSAAELPKELRRMLQDLEDYLGCPIHSIGIGPRGDQVIFRQGNWALAA